MRTMHTLTAATIALAALLSTACDRTPAPTALTDSGPAPVMDFTNGPANPGQSHVMRIEGFFVFAGIDPDRGLLSANGLGVDDPALSVLCAGLEPPEVMSIQGFANDETIHRNVSGTDVTQHVWAFDGTRGVLDVICDDAPIAAGRGNFRLIDAQEFGVEGTRGWMAQGKLADAGTGQTVRYSENQRAVIRDGQANWLAEDIHLTWVGNTP